MEYRWRRCLQMLVIFLCACQCTFDRPSLDKVHFCQCNRKTKMGYPSSGIMRPNRSQIDDVTLQSVIARTDSTPSPTIPYVLPGVPGPSNHQTRIPDYSHRGLKRSINVDAQLHLESQVVTQIPKNNENIKRLKCPVAIVVNQNSEVAIMASKTHSSVSNQQEQNNNVPLKKRRVEKAIYDGEQILTQSKKSGEVRIRNEIAPNKILASKTIFDTFENLKVFLQAMTLKSKEKELRKCKKRYNENEYTTDLDEQIKDLEKHIKACKKIRKNIVEKLSSPTMGKLKCNTCSVKYNNDSTFITHVLNCHREKIVENCKRAEDEERPRNSARIYARTSETIEFAESEDDASTLSSVFHSPSSQISLTTPQDRSRNEHVYAPLLSDEPRPSTSNPTDTNFLEIEPIDRVNTRASNKTAGPAPSISNEDIETEVEDMYMVLRKPINLFGSESFDLFEKESKKIKSWLKKSNKSPETVDQRNSKKNKKNKKSHSHNNTIDDDAPMKRYYMAVIYSEDELNQIKHCYNLNPNSASLCQNCLLNLVKYQANAYAQSNKAFKEQEKIVNNKALNPKHKKELLKELYKKDDYRLIRKRLETLRKHRQTFDLITDLIRFSVKYFKMFETSFNDKMFQESVKLIVRQNKKFKFGLFCGKLMDDIANEFLVHVTVTCMNFAYNDKRITLTEEHLRKYQLLFETTNKDATYFEPFPSVLRKRIKTKYSNYLPTSKNLEIIIIDCLLRYSFCDINSLHENLDKLIFEHLKSPQPIFKFLMYMKFSRPYLTSLNGLLLRFLSKVAIQVLQLKKDSNSGYEVSYNELIEACEIVGVFSSSYTNYLKRSYGQYYAELRRRLANTITDLTRDYSYNKLQ
ncbi:uncharacterized protein LOC100680398 isoform X2 [Nasonia vitripennis]|uniref:C2H2-type domain-containing protein n=1 Tax=Nasonia vitripennis TaxID=7425 RepID=A0A7M7QK66_NASVI|nr:uncharacterized protein LOC100680398 isoform X2 [Nasonia vitripennis]